MRIKKTKCINMSHPQINYNYKLPSSSVAKIPGPVANMQHLIYMKLSINNCILNTLVTLKINEE